MSSKGGGCVGGLFKLAIGGFGLLVLIGLLIGKKPHTNEKPRARPQEANQPAPQPLQPETEQGHPAPAVAQRDEPDETIDGLSTAKRKEIYAELHQGGLDASRAAELRYPGRKLAGLTPEQVREVMRQRRSFYESQKKKSRSSLVGKYKVDGKILNRIQDEGDRKEWPVSGF